MPDSLLWQFVRFLQSTQKHRPPMTRPRMSLETLESRRMLALNPTGLEQEMMELVNRVRMDPAGEPDRLFISTDPSNPNYFVSTDPDVNIAIDFFNTDPAAFFAQWSSVPSAPPLAWNEALYDSAEDHNREMISQNTQSHQLPGEPPLLTRAENAGYNWAGSVSVGENVFAYTESLLHGQTAFIVDWGTGPNGIQSPAGHRDNLMDDGWREVGISILNSSLTGIGDVGPLVMTQDFGLRGNYGNPRVLGVAFADSDGDGFYDNGEGLGGITITVSDGTNSYTTTTMTAGGYQVAVPSGTYSVTASGGSLAGTLAMGSVTVGSVNTKIDLNTSATASISGTVFLDVNENGVDDADAKLAGRTVFLDTNANGQLDAGESSAITNAAGDYALQVTGAGTYTVALTSELEYRPSLGSTTSQSVSATLAAGAVDVDFGQVKFVSMNGTTLNVFGNSNDDVMSWSAGPANHTIVAHGQTLTYSNSSFNRISFFGAGGNDQLSLTSNAVDDYIVFRPSYTELSNSLVRVSGTNVGKVSADLAGGTDDRAVMYDGIDDNDMIVHPTWAKMIGSKYEFFVTGSERVFAYANAGGIDATYLYDGPTDDRFIGRPEFSIFQGNNLEFYTYMQGFERNFGYATQGGEDYAFFYDSAGDDRFFGHATFAAMEDTGKTYFNYASGFDRVFAYATKGGDDEAFLFDGASNDTFYGRPTYSIFRGNAFEFYNRAQGFDKVHAYSQNGGADQAQFHDSAGHDTFQGYTTYGSMSGTGYFNYAHGFSQLIAFSKLGGTDRAYLYDSPDDDLFFAELNYGVMSNPNFFNRAQGFTSIQINGESGGTNRLNTIAPLGFSFSTVGTWI